MKRAITLIASVGIFAAVSCHDAPEKFLPEEVSKSVEVERHSELDIHKERDVEENHNSNFFNSEDQEKNMQFAVSSNLSQDFDKEFEASSKQVASGDVRRAVAGARKAEFEGIKSFNNHIREGQMAFVKSQGTDSSNKNLELHNEYLEETEHINSEKDGDCEKVNQQKWMKKKHQKKQIKHKSNGDRNATLVKKRGKGYRKHANEERKNRHHQNRNNNESNSFVRVNKNRIHTDLEVNSNNAHAISGSKHEAQDKERSGTDARSETKKVQVDINKDVDINTAKNFSIKRD